MKEHLKIVVKTIRMTDKVCESEKVINHNNKEDRVWLGKHCYWAFRNERMIITYPLEENNG